MTEKGNIVGIMFISDLIRCLLVGSYDSPGPKAQHQGDSQRAESQRPTYLQRAGYFAENRTREHCGTIGSSTRGSRRLSWR